MNNSFTALKVLFVAALATALMTGCGGGGSDAPAQAASSRSPVTDAARASTKTIGPGGGSVTATAANGTTYTLDIPAGALTAPVEIRLTPITDMGSAPLAAQTFGAVQFEPSGLVFKTPATLRIGAVPTRAGGRKLVGFSTANDGGNFRLNLARVVGNSTLVNVTHFSTGGAAEATVAELPPLVPLAVTLRDADHAMEQLSALTARDAGLVQIVDVFRQWYVEIVKPALDQADGSNDIVFGITAIAEYQLWINAMDFMPDRASFDIALADKLNEARPIATRVFIAFINGRLNDCMDASGFTESRLAILDLASFIQQTAQNRGLASNGSGLDRATFLLRANNCVRPVLNPITLPSPLTIGTGKSLDARAQAVFSGTPNPQSVPFTFTVTATGASVQNPEGFSDADGRYTTVFTPSASAPRFTVKACLVAVADVCVSQDVSGGLKVGSTLSGTIRIVGTVNSTGEVDNFSGFVRLRIAPDDNVTILDGTASALNKTFLCNSFPGVVFTDGPGSVRYLVPFPGRFPIGTFGAFLFKEPGLGCLVNVGIQSLTLADGRRISSGTNGTGKLAAINVSGTFLINGVTTVITGDLLPE